MAGSGSWRDRAACAGRPVSWWFPDKLDGDSGARAKAICGECPVKNECLSDALRVEAGQRYPSGIRAGLTATARSTMRRPRRRVR